MQLLKHPTVTDTIQLHVIHWFGHVEGMEENGIPRRLLCLNLEATRIRGRPRNRWKNEVVEDGRLVGGKV
jgi:hypothetical protein